MIEDEDPHGEAERVRVRRSERSCRYSRTISKYGCWSCLRWFAPLAIQYKRRQLLGGSRRAHLAFEVTMSPKPATRLPKHSSLQEMHYVMSRKAIAVELGCSEQRIGEIER